MSTIFDVIIVYNSFTKTLRQFKNCFPDSSFKIQMSSDYVQQLTNMFWQFHLSSYIHTYISIVKCIDSIQCVIHWTLWPVSTIKWRNDLGPGGPLSYQIHILHWCPSHFKFYLTLTHVLKLLTYTLMKLNFKR